MPINLADRSITGHLHDCRRGPLAEQGVGRNPGGGRLKAESGGICMMPPNQKPDLNYVECSEQKRLNDAREQAIPWKKWGPYLSERQWGTVREDYSQDGNAWDYFTHDQARSRAYRWGEDGMAGISDDKQQLCLALALWNGRDPILKERMIGLTNSEANHGEDVKEYYFYVDSTPTHSYMKYLYKYPQREFPYRDLIETNRRRSREEFEYELLDTGIFNDDRYFDVFVEYAKADPEDILARVADADEFYDRITPASLSEDDAFKVECPTHLGNYMTLFEVAKELQRRLARIFLRDESGNRPVYGGTRKFQEDPYWREYILFYEYFHGDNGAGLGASHQTGWTGLIARLLDMFARTDSKRLLETSKLDLIAEMTHEQVAGR